MSRKFLNSLVCAMAVALCLSTFVIGQEITGSILGTVKDSAGGVVPGATVTITDPSKGNLVVRNLTTNSSGEFSAPNLTISTYSVTVEAPNFKKSVQTDIKVDVGQRRSVEIVLEAGRIEEVVTVEADPVSVDLTSATSGTIISGDQVRELSNNNRNFTQLVALAPGVSSDLADQVYVGTTNPDGQANIVQLAVNGARSSQNTFTVDGSDITDRGSNLTIQAYPSVDSIGEFRVLRSLYPAEAGRSGGGQVNVVTRSGTSRFSGSAFEFIRNDAFNANNFLTNSQTNPQFGREDPNDPTSKARRAPVRYNNFGWTLGGPVYFFNFGENDGGFFRRWDKTFFFFSQEFRRDNRFALPNSVTVPDANLKQGIFPIDVCINRTDQPAENCTVGNPGRLAAGTPIPANMLSPAAAAYVRDIYSNLPNPNSGTASNPYLSSFSLPNNFKFQQEIVKIDHAFTDNLSGYYRYGRDSIPTIEGNALFSSGSGLPDVSTTSTDSPGRTHTLQMTWSVRPNVIIEGRYNYGYGAILSENIGLLSLERSSIPVTLPFSNERDRVPTLIGNGFTGFTSFGPYDNFSWKQNFTESLTWINGSHTMKFGSVYSLYRKNENALAGFNEGRFSVFVGTVASGVANTTLNQNLQRWANFLVGNVGSSGFTQSKFDYTADLRQKAFEAYAQDEWKAFRTVTLYFGVRYSFFGSPWDENGRLSNFDPELWQPSEAPEVGGNGSRIAGTGNNCNGLIVNAQNFTTGPISFNCRPTASPLGKFIIDAKKNNFAPRVGIAWDPFGKGNTSIRTGYGIYHEQVLNGIQLQNIGTNPPYQETITSGTSARLDTPAGNVVGAPAVQSLRAIQTDFHTPYTQHWSFDIQRQLAKRTVLSAGYYGSKGTHLIGLTEMNSIAPGVALNSTCINAYGQSVPCQTEGYVFRNRGSNTVNVPNNPNTNQNNPTQQTTDILILDQIRPYRGYRSIAMVQPRYNSNYHSLQVSGTHRFSGASQVNLAYTWAKNLTDSQNDRSAAPQNTYDTKSEYSRAALDRRHVLSINYVYEIPFFSAQRGFVGKLLGGWQASGIVTYNTGLPFTAVTSNYDPAGSGIINANPTARPNQLCDPNGNAPKTFAQWFDISCFQRNPGDTEETDVPNVFGSAARGTINGPSTKRVDFTMSKNIRFNERFRLQLRAEAFNIFNWTNFRGFVSTNVTSSSFGRVGSVRDPRTMQFGAKFYF